MITYIADIIEIHCGTIAGGVISVSVEAVICNKAVGWAALRHCRTGDAPGSDKEKKKAK
jgi:hypothetical protein